MALSTGFEELLDGAWEAVISTDTDFRVRYLNAAAEHATGMPRGRALGRPLAELLAGDFGGDIPVLGEDWHCERVSDGWAVYGSARAGQGAHRLQRMLEAEQLAAVGQIAATVAHEIGAPLTAISVAAEYLMKRECGSGPGAAELQVISAQAHRIGELTRRLVDLARPGEPVFRAIDLNEAVTAAFELVSRQLDRADVAARLALGTGSYGIHADPNQIQQVVINLVLNARRAMEKTGGSLEVSTRATPGWAELVVADTGPGIDAQDLHMIFLPFFSRFGGTGLGLALTRQIVYRHGGTIGAAASPGGGATFIVRLPRMTND